MENLNLTKNQFAVAQAKYSTGIVLRNDGSHFRRGDNINDIYEIFNNLEEAKEFVLKKVSTEPTIECYITNYNNETVFAYDKSN